MDWSLIAIQFFTRLSDQPSLGLPSPWVDPVFLNHMPLAAVPAFSALLVPMWTSMPMEPMLPKPMTSSIHSVTYYILVPSRQTKTLYSQSCFSLPNYGVGPILWRAVFTFIHWIADIYNWFADIYNWIGDICKYRLFVDISNWIVDICKSIVDISNSIGDISNSIEDIYKYCLFADISNWIVDISKRIADIYNSIGDIYNSSANVALVNKIRSLWASYLYNIMARSVQEITSFMLVSIIIIIHNVINNKVFLYTAFD